ncbi:hypothetical protein Tco_0769055 [Tanacetum coccineum]|uniref:Uncharacterized protein n=1 Tax=Tanacetum coccineum TaxID=301880 RepID=A0ABQ4Z8D5_9ASTR
MDSMYSTLSMYYDYDAHVKGELLVMMKISQSVNLLIFISNTLIELFNDFGFDCDGIPERPTMYLNLWSYKVVRYRYSNPMIQPEPEGSTQGYPLDSVEVLRFYTSAGNPVKEILLKLNLPDHRSILMDSKMVVKYMFQDFRYSDTERLSRSDEVLKLKNFKKDATLKLSKSTNQEWYEHVSPEVTRSQDDKVTRWRNEIMLASDKTTSLSASTFSFLNASLWADSIILLTRLDFTLFFLLNASPTTFALSEYHTNHSSKSEKPLLVLRSTHTSDSSQLGKSYETLVLQLSKLFSQFLAFPRGCKTEMELRDWRCSMNQIYTELNLSLSWSSINLPETHQ